MEETFCKIIFLVMYLYVFYCVVVQEPEQQEPKLFALAEQESECITFSVPVPDST